MIITCHTWSYIPLHRYPWCPGLEAKCKPLLYLVSTKYIFQPCSLAHSSEIIFCGSNTIMRMLEHVLLRCAGDTLNGFSYLNIPLAIILFCYFIFRDRQLEKWFSGGLGGFKDTQDVPKSVTQSTITLCIRISSAPQWALFQHYNRSKSVTDVSTTKPSVRSVICSIFYNKIEL